MIKVLKRMWRKIWGLLEHYIGVILNWFYKREENINEDDPIGNFDELDYMRTVIGSEFIIPKKDIKQGMSTDVNDVMDDIVRNLVSYNIDDQTITIMVSKTLEYVSQTSTVTTTDDDNFKIVKHDDMVIMIPTVKYLGVKYELLVNHAITYTDWKDLDKYRQINPLILVKSKKVREVQFEWKVKQKTQISWYTYNWKISKHVYAETQVLKPIYAHIKIKGRYKITCVAIVVSIINEPEIVYSGSVMIVDSKPFIVVYGVELNDEKTKVMVAIALMSHNYTINLKIVDSAKDIVKHMAKTGKIVTWDKKALKNIQ